MNKRASLSLSTILFVLIGTLAYPCAAGKTSARALDNRGGSVMRADGDPMPPPPPFPREAGLGHIGLSAIAA